MAGKQVGPMMDTTAVQQLQLRESPTIDQNHASATTQAESRDTNYAAMYWPWIKIPDADLGRNVWVPASTLIPTK